MNKNYMVSSESCNIGHPDKTMDVMADNFLDYALKEDPNAQMAVECSIKNNLVMIYGEATTTANIPYECIAKKVLKDIGYDLGYKEENFEFKIKISQQSPDINQAVICQDGELRANDQGMVYGYASNETKELMPMPIVIAHKIMKRYDDYRRNLDLSKGLYLPDAKSQVTIEYENDKPIKIKTIILSVSHNESLTNEQIESDMKKYVINVVLQEYLNLINGEIKYLINTSGKFTIWGSYSDSGAVGRKIVVDTYGGIGRVGGGCFSSKNATKVDRSGAYYARYVAKNIVANNLADKTEIQIAYGIGIAKPISLYIDCFGTEKIPMEDIYKIVEENFDFSVCNMIKELDLLKPIYKETACYGHFGRNEFSWEQFKKLI